jgi:DNA polymerase-1
MERTREQARTQGYVETVFGRRLRLEYIHARNAAQRAGAERAAINAPMQGSAADIIKLAMVAVDGWLAAHTARALLLMQVHDELVFEVDTDFVPEVLQTVPGLMAGVAQLRVPLVVDAGSGNNWEEAH